MNTNQVRKDINAIIARLKELEMILGTANPGMLQEISKGIEEQSQKLSKIAASLVPAPVAVKSKK